VISWRGRVLTGFRHFCRETSTSAKFELMVNMMSANSIGLAIPDSFLLRTGEVIE
jgi:hypothetical protein